jgi:hypothetical protein
LPITQMKLIRKILRLFGYKPKQKDLKVFIRQVGETEWKELACEDKATINSPRCKG